MEGSFLREVNVGTSYTPTPLTIFKWNTTIDDGVLSWACPAVSPRSAGFACPVSLYGTKARIPPTRAERGQEPMIRRRSHAAGSGPNYQRSRRRIRRRNPHPVAQTRALFKRPRCLQRLGNWAFPTSNHALSTTDTDDNNDGSISVSDMAHESCDDEDNASPIDQTSEEQCLEWIDDADDSSAISRHSCSELQIVICFGLFSLSSKVNLHTRIASGTNDLGHCNK